MEGLLIHVPGYEEEPRTYKECGFTKRKFNPESTTICRWSLLKLLLKYNGGIRIKEEAITYESKIRKAISEIRKKLNKVVNVTSSKEQIVSWKQDGFYTLRLKHAECDDDFYDDQVKYLKKTFFVTDFEE